MRAETDAARDDAIRADRHRLAEFRASLDDCGRMHVRQDQASTSMALTSASATLTPSTRASAPNRQIFERRRIFRTWIFDRVAGNDRPAELGIVDRHEVDELRPGRCGLGRHAERAGRLRHALDQEHARHDRMIGKMPQ